MIHIHVDLREKIGALTQDIPVKQIQPVFIALRSLRKQRIMRIGRSLYSDAVHERSTPSLVCARAIVKGVILRSWLHIPLRMVFNHAQVYVYICLMNMYLLRIK